MSEPHLPSDKDKAVHERVTESFRQNPAAALASPTETLGEVPGKTSPQPAGADTGPLLAGHYRIEGEIARGGMGVVLRAHDPNLHRTLAIKVLHEKAEGISEYLARFLSEARITAQLQHPGIPPVHEVGTLPDGRPFFAMKLIEGRTLADLLACRPSAGADLPHFAGIFEQVCNTVGYAHSRGVIHRDLKPSNIMVGSFGEVQVMDWGLAKVLPLWRQVSQLADGGSPPVCQPTDVGGQNRQVGKLAATGEGEHTQAGAVLGTFAYMPPEQARGEVLDERADVFGLGSILCEILTGLPPYTAAERMDVYHHAVKADLADALRRLQTSGADADLIQLARRCLAERQEDRPADGGAVAQTMSAWQEGVRARLRQAELERAHAQIKMAEERKRRRLAIGLALALVVLVCVAVGGWAWLNHQQLAHAAERQQHLDKMHNAVTTALEQSANLGRQQRWGEAAALLEVALARLGEEGDEESRQQLRQALAEVRLVATLERIRQQTALRGGSRWEGPTSGEKYAQELKQIGLDLENGDVEKLARQVSDSRLREHLVAALDHWASLFPKQAIAERLLAVASQADPDPWKNRLRNLATWDDRQALQKLAATADPARLSPALIVLLAERLWKMRLPVVDLLARAQQHHPDDFWLNFTLGTELMHFATRREEAISYLRAALVSRPGSAAAWTNLANALREKGDLELAQAHLEKARQLAPDSPLVLANLALVWNLLGRSKEALALVEKAVQLDEKDADVISTKGAVLEQLDDLAGAEAAFRKAIALAPGLGNHHVNLGMVLSRQGDKDGALAAFRKAVELQPDSGRCWSYLALGLQAHGELDEAEKAVRRGLALDPRLAVLHAILGTIMADRKRFKEAVAHLQEARSLNPRKLGTRNVLLEVYRRMGDRPAAIACAREMVALFPHHPEAHQSLVAVLGETGALPEAEQVASKARGLFPNNAAVASTLGTVRARRGNRAGAITAYREALRLKPAQGETAANLAHVLLDSGKPDEAEPLLLQAVESAPKSARAHAGLARIHAERGDWPRAIAAYRRAAELDGKEPGYPYQLGNLLIRQGDMNGARKAFEQAIAANAKFTAGYTNLGNVLASQGKWRLAVVPYRKAAELAPNEGKTHSNLGNALGRTGDMDGAVAALRKAVALEPKNSIFHINLGAALLNKGDRPGALAAFREAATLEPNNPRAHGALGEALLGQGQADEARTATRRSLDLLPENHPLRPIVTRQLRLCEQAQKQQKRLAAVAAGKEKPASAAESIELASLAGRIGKPALCVRLYTSAFTDKPDLLHRGSHRYQAACAAVWAASGQGDGDECDDTERMRLADTSNELAAGGVQALAEGAGRGRR